jgi:hypothetical protein
MGIGVTGSFISFMFERKRNQINILTVIVLVAGLNQRIYGYKDYETNLLNIIINTCGFLVSIPLYMYCN